MYAVIESGGKQYRVELGTEIQVDRLDARPGDSITLDRVLLIADEDRATVGRPFVEGAVVSAAVLAQARGEKVVVFKYRPKARRRVKKGFRAALTTLRISDIAFGGSSAADEAAREARRRSDEERRAEQEAAERAAADQALAARLVAEARDAEPAPDPGTETAEEPEGGGATKAKRRSRATTPRSTASKPRAAAKAGSLAAGPPADEGAASAEAHGSGAEADPAGSALTATDAAQPNDAPDAGAVPMPITDKDE